MTAAMARAAEALHPYWAERYPSGSQADDMAHDAVSAALHDPADPDWLARVIDDAALMRTGRSIGLLASVDVADAVRAAILGGAS